jgi:dTMP kinase
MLISFSGPDCSGKSTQISLLAAALTARGHRCAVVWHRPGYSKLLNMARAAVRRLRPDALPSQGDASRDRAFSRPLLRRSWAAMGLADSCAHSSLRVRGLLVTSQTVICDRYVDDALLDLDLRFPEQALLKSPGAAFLRGLAARPQFSFLLLLPWKEIVLRAERKTEPFPDALDLRRVRYLRYQELAATGRYIVIDAARSAEEVHREILGHVTSN